MKISPFNFVPTLVIISMITLMIWTSKVGADFKCTELNKLGINQKVDCLALDLNKPRNKCYYFDVELAINPTQVKCPVVKSRMQAEETRAKPAEPVKPVEPAKPCEPVKPAEPVKPVVTKADIMAKIPPGSKVLRAKGLTLLDLNPGEKGEMIIVKSEPKSEKI